MSECVREPVRGAGKGWNEKCLVDKAKYLRLGQRPFQSQGEAAGASRRGFIVMLVFRVPPVSQGAVWRNEAHVGCGAVGLVVCFTPRNVIC